MIRAKCAVILSLFSPLKQRFLHLSGGVTQTEGAGVTQTGGGGVTHTDFEACGALHAGCPMM
ncbi:MAG: hypothetical protein J5924_01645 [Bacteroidaceae bacterium]|nr:hypothetical protein [Bacteroidaceae bacterium]